MCNKRCQLGIGRTSENYFGGLLKGGYTSCISIKKTQNGCFGVAHILKIWKNHEKIILKKIWKFFYSKISSSNIWNVAGIWKGIDVNDQFTHQVETGE